jgi:hypothetical protein
MRRSFPVVAATAFLAAIPALAGEGRIPIPFTNPPTTPVVIGSPGRYIMTRNLFPTGVGPIIDVAVPGDVDIDLNGMVLDQAGVVDAVIRISVPGPGTVVIRNGALRSGSVGIEAPLGNRTVVIENIQINDMTGAGISLSSVENYAIRGCVMQNTTPGILVTGANHHGIIEKNLIRRCGDGIVLFNPKAVSVLGNTLQEIFAAGFATGIQLDNGIGCLVAENTIEECSGLGNTAIRLKKTTGSKLFDNVVSRSALHGIHLDLNSHDNLVWKNVVREAGSGGGHGIFIESDRNLVEGNLSNFNAGKGLVFVAGADNNVYRGNTCRGNNTLAVGCAGACGPGTDFCNAGAGNASQLDNFLPLAPCN